MRTKPKRKYKVINKHPIYNSEEEKLASYKEAALKLALEAERLRILYPNENF